jgi:predicted permease
LLLLLGSGVVLALGLLNIATLTVARSRRYLGDFATRHALGACWRSIAAPLVAQSVLIASLAGTGALGVTGVLIALMKRVGLSDIPRADSVRLDTASAVACLGAVVVASAIVTIAPLVFAARMPLAVALRDAARDRRAAAGARHLRRVLVVGQIAAAFLLLATMGWTLVSLVSVLSENPGFTPRGLATVSFDLPRQQYHDVAEAHDVIRRVVRAVTELEGVQAAGVTQLLPLGGRTASWSVHRTDQTAAESVVMWNYVVGPGYFSAMEVPLEAGRYLDERDTAASEPVVVIARGLAKRFWPNGDPIGQQLVFPDMVTPRPVTVVGVVGDVRQVSLTEASSSSGATYRPYTQVDERSFTLVARVPSPDVDPAVLSAAIRSVDARLAPYEGVAMSQRVSASVAPRRLVLVNATVFAGAALLLATVGLYAVLTYLVTERHREFGIRLALGSSPRALASSVVVEGMAMAVAGLGVGGVVLRWVRPALAPQLHGIDGWDLPIVLAAGGLITATALAAAFVPARHASRVDPVVVLQG